MPPMVLIKRNFPSRYPRNRARRKQILSPLVIVLLIHLAGLAQQASQTVSIQVHVDQPDGRLSPVWNYFGYDEPNYTYAPNGKKLLGELAATNAVPVYIRTHN